MTASPTIASPVSRTEVTPFGKRIEERGTISDLGDTALVGRWTFFQKREMSYTAIFNLLAGVKFPTGDASKLNTPDSDLPEGIAGHDLALGSGSYDGIVGTGIYGRWKRGFVTANVQYAIRSEGDFQHQYANDWTWTAGPGAYLRMTDTYTLALQVAASGESKGADTFAGVPDGDSAETIVYVGPELMFTHLENFSAHVGVDLPVAIQNASFERSASLNSGCSGSPKRLLFRSATNSLSCRNSSPWVLKK